MEEKELNSLIVVEQLPKIKQQLQIISDEIESKIQYAMSLDCTEENIKEVKNVRAELNKIKTSLEDKRKQVKSAVLQPYEEFEGIYNELVKDKLQVADNTLKNEIDEIENAKKNEKERELRLFVDIYCQANNVDIPFEKIGLNITLSASMSSLKEQAKTFVEKVVSDLKLIELEEYSSEILYEYNQCFDYVAAKTAVLERHKKLEEIKNQQEANQQNTEQEKKIVEAVDEIIAPVEIGEKEVYEFKITATKEQVKQLVEYMKSIGIEYE